MLLLLDFFAGRAPLVISRFPAVKDPMSVVMFSLSRTDSSKDGVCAMDFRDFDRRIAGRVTSSREAIFEVDNLEVPSDQVGNLVELICW